MNCDAKVINIAGWKIKSPQTSDVYIFPFFVARPGCSAFVQITVDTHTSGPWESPQGPIFTWARPLGMEEWPKRPGRVQVFDSSGAKIVDCGYTPDPNRFEVECK